ncbi:MAG TPA: carboxypeptidase-like regulatory domain-containing protein [Candidatus Sulfotelmatobacter sp.]|nr:carboxypeptidase-like regulatory domain-containing protein [Candidatus Sulfotelmatobacter sp.]
MPRSLRYFAVLLFSSLLSSVLVAQSTTSLRGVVSDSKGAVLPGATVKIYDSQTGFTRIVTSGADGVYQFLQIPPATYSLTISANGFANVQRENVTLLVNSPATLNFSMQVEGTTIKVEVTSEAPLVNTQDASIGNAFSERQLIRLPSEGRDPVSILSLQPGVTFIGSDKQIDQSNDSRGGSVSGARSDQTNITLDGLDDNEQLLGYAFQGALRATLDSIQEFRVTTSNGNADEGRSSGGQVSLVTKSGANNFHGSAYEYNRSSIGEANDWFNKKAQVGAGLANIPPHLIRNTFGATFGGPVKKDRLFFFLAYEGQRKRETTQVTQTVPSDQLMSGIIQYLCDPTDPANVHCVPGAHGNGVTVAPNTAISANDYVVQLSQAAFARMDPNAAGNGTCPWADSAGECGVDPNVLAVFKQYPHANTDTVGDLLNYRGFTFAGADPEKLNTYIVRLDYGITANGNHKLFLRGNLQNDNQALAPQFPGQPSSDFHTGNNKGIAAGYTALLSPTLINSFRWSLVREGIGDAGINTQPYVHFRTLSDLTGLASQSEFVNVPVHNFVDDLTWTKGKHTWQFGTNLRLVHNNRSGNFENVSYAVTDPFSLDNVAIANTGSSLDPSTRPFYPTVDPAFGELYDFAAMGLAGVVTVSNSEFNQDKTGNVIPQGELVPRHFKAWEAEWYVQDAWRAKPNLVLTFGLRYSLLQPPYEVDGNQASPTISVGNLFAQRAKAQLLGQAYSPGQNATNGVSGGIDPVTFGLSGQGNGKQPYWNWDYKNLAPRFALAYSPAFDHGWLHSLFGSAGKSSVRMGYGLYFDHFGEGLVNTFDRNGSFGLTTVETNPYGVQDVDCAFRFTGIHDLPQGQYCGQQMNGTPPGTFPVTPPLGINANGGFAIYWGMDDKLKTPYSHVFNFSFSRDLGHDFALEASYVGRLGRHLLQETDLALPEDIVDPASHMDYFTAATMFSKLARAGTDVGDVQPIPYWEHLFPTAGGDPGTQLWGCDSIPFANIGATLTNTQAMYDTFACNVRDEIVALQYVDTPSNFGACFPACSQLPGQSAPTPYNFFMPQFSSLWGWRSSGNSAYHAFNLTLRRALRSGVQFDVNYTFSKSIDVGSNAERVNVFDNVGGFSSQVINSWAPNQLRAVSDFDMRHQINSNWVVDLPVGRGRRFGGGMGRLADAIVGGWSLTGLFHWSSGLPFSIFPGGGWATNYNLTGEAVQVSNPGKVGVHRDASGNPNMFADPQAVINDFRAPFPGEGGQRNELRGPGFFGIDAGLDKDWKIREGQTLSFAWEAFNVTNAVRFDAAASSNNFDLTSSTNFGVYGSTLTQPRVMQFMLRFTF